MTIDYRVSRTCRRYIQNSCFRDEAHQAIRQSILTLTTVAELCLLASRYSTLAEYGVEKAVSPLRVDSINKYHDWQLFMIDKERIK